MTEEKNPERNALDRLLDAAIDDILSAPDEDILAEYQEDGGDPEQLATEMRALFRKPVIIANKGRMTAAKAAVAMDSPRIDKGKTPIDFTKERRRLRNILENPEIVRNLTLAARKESEMSDNDVLGMLENLRELGIVHPNEADDEKP